MGRLAGKRAVVTGASSGIGRAIANRFAAEGAAVASLLRIIGCRWRSCPTVYSVRQTPSGRKLVKYSPPLARLISTSRTPK